MSVGGLRILPVSRSGFSPSASCGTTWTELDSLPITATLFPFQSMLGDQLAVWTRVPLYVSVPSMTGPSER